MKTPVRKSLTRLCAPKPSATPTTPALARIGREVDAEHGEDEDDREREDDERADALEQAADRLGALTHPGDRGRVAHPDRRARPGAGAPAGQRVVGERADDSVDEPVQDPPGDDGDDRRR